MKNFDESINRTSTLYRLVKRNVHFTKGFIEYFSIEKLSAKASNDTATQYKNILNLEIPNDALDYFSEIAFTAMFSNFEYFTVELLKELWQKYPNSFNSEKSYTYEEIKGFDEIKNIKEYIVDKEANVRSSNLEEWGKYLKNTYKIDPFKIDKGDLLSGLIHMSQIRDSLMHSRGKVSSILLAKIKTSNYTGEKFNLGDKFLQKWSYDEMFLIQADLLRMVSENISKWSKSIKQ